MLCVVLLKCVRKKEDEDSEKKKEDEDSEKKKEDEDREKKNKK